MTGGATMAKAKKPAGKAKPDPDLMVPRTLKVRQEYADWLDRFATRERVTKKPVPTGLCPASTMRTTARRSRSSRSSRPLTRSAPTRRCEAPTG